MTRSVLAPEVFAVVHAFDYASTLRATISDMFGRSILITVYTDSKSLYDTLTGINATSEKRWLFDLAILREAYELHEIAEIIWVPSSDNPADAMTKYSAKLALRMCMKTNAIAVLSST